MTSFSEPILRHLKAIHEELGETSASSGPVSFDKFLGDVTSTAYDAMAPLVCDESYPLSNYFISSSHNTYLSGNQLYGRASTDAYKNVLTRGCRCVEIDVWDGEDDSSSSSASSDDEQAEGDHKEGRFKKLRGRFKRELGLGAKGKPKVESRADSPPTDASEYKMPTPWRSQFRRTEPVVLHGHTATREVPFRQVCETIGRHAFQTTDLPLIVSLEIHTCPEQQKIMVEIMKDLWKDCLVDRSPSDELNTPLPSLLSLRRKILIKVKYSPPQATSVRTKHDARVESAAQQASAGVSSDEETQLETKQKMSSIIDALSSMGVYTRACHFKNFDQPEATIPTHVFALSEKRLREIHEHDPSALFRHNKHFLMRAYPKGLRVSSSNLDPAVFWRQGVQIVALNWQSKDEANQLNEAMFAGSGGWVLKPEGYRAESRSTAQSAAAKRATLDLKIEFLAGQNLYFVNDGNEQKRFRPRVKCELHVERSEERQRGKIPEGGKTKEGELKRKIESEKATADPDFGRQVVEFYDVKGVVPELSFVRVKVISEDTFGRDKLAFWACFRLDRLQEGYRLMRLHDVSGELSPDAVLLVRVRKDLSFDDKVQ
ncbi:hypothetical protein LTR66_002245 [Elasticomyces elasticus]|nr:hypothetical protein LTR66_002245 [Elasticomyces elasticus]